MAAPAAPVTITSVVHKANFATSTTAHRDIARVALRTAMVVVFQSKEKWTVASTVDHHPDGSVMMAAATVTMTFTMTVKLALPRCTAGMPAGGKTEADRFASIVESAQTSFSLGEQGVQSRISAQT